MDLKLLCSIAGVKPEDVRAIFLVGSRLYGTASDTSDFDYLFVVNNFIPSNTITNGEIFENLHTDMADIGIYETNYWRALLSEYQEMFAIACLFAPKNNVK